MKKRLSRLKELRLLKLSTQEYKLIGETVVLSGMLEMEMKQAIVRMVDAPWPDGLALVAHLNFGSLCDIAEALIPSTIISAHIRDHFQKAIRECRAAYERRNTLVHGPLSPIIKVKTGKNVLFRVTARAKVAYKPLVVTGELIKKQLEALIRAYEYFWWCQLVLEEERDGLAFQHGLTRSHKAVLRAKTRKP